MDVQLSDACSCFGCYNLLFNIFDKVLKVAEYVCNLSMYCCKAGGTCSVGCHGCTFSH